MRGEFEPMLAATFGDVTKCAWPKLGSPKVDGHRCLIREAVALTRNLKPVPNEFIQRALGRKELNGLDGELVVGPSWEPKVYNRTSSGVRARGGDPDFTFLVFDDFSVNGHAFKYRLGHAEDRIDDFNSSRLVLLPHTEINSAAGLEKYEKSQLEMGYEGVVLRCPEARYKFGRATEVEDSLWKVKRFTDGEALVTGVEEGMVNTNEATTDEVGRTKRSTAKAGMVPSGLVGTLLCIELKTGKPIRVSPGRLTAAERRHFWLHQKEILKRVIIFKAFEYGAKDEDRFRNFQAFRPDSDLPVEVKAAAARAATV